MSNAGTQTIKVSRAFSSNMVLQRNAPIKVWGTADEGITSVSGEFMGESACARVDESGEWTLEFSARDTVNSSQILKICADGLDPVVFDNVLIGDVYFITGQSNAEMAIGSCINAYPEERSDLYRENVRLFTQSIPYIIERKELWPVPQKDVVNPEWHWKKAVDDAAIYEFSAIGYFFGRVIADKLPELPIGLIMGAAGGSQIIELMSGETSKRLGYSQSATVGASGYYNNLINPFIRMPIRAMIYYQGESECWPTATPDYGRNLDELVKDLRNVWGIPFKFYNVQLSSHGEESKTSWPTIGEIRAVQYDAVNTIPDYYIVPSYDCGKKDEDPDFAHPYYKKLPGERIAKLVLSEEYKLADIEYSSCPCVDKVYKEDGCVNIVFRYVGDGLRLSEGSELKGFQLEANGELTDAKASITGRNTVKVITDKAAEYVCYAVQVLPDKAGANLINSENIPAPAFKASI